MGARSTPKIVQNFYKGETSKIVLIAVGFAAVFATIKPLDYFALFFTFSVAIVSNVVLVHYLKSEHRK